MSIYSTGWSILVQVSPAFPEKYCDSKLTFGYPEKFAEVYVQFVPGHIGHPSEGGNDDYYRTFLPPVAKDPDGTRAAVILLSGWDKKDGQKYTSPIATLSYEEYQGIKFEVMLDMIERRIGELVKEYPEGNSSF